MKTLFPGFFIGILLFSCSGSPPLILDTQWMPVYRYDTERQGIYTELNLYLRLEDEDGIEDISELKIYKDDEAWFWSLGPDEWSLFQEADEQWLGSGGLTRGDVLPGGEYRVQIADRSGQSHETVIAVDIHDFQPGVLDFPRIQIKGDFLQISLEKMDQIILWFYDEKGVLIKEQYSKEGLHPIKEYLKSSEQQICHTFMAYYQDEANGYGMKSGPYLFNHPEK